MEVRDQEFHGVGKVCKLCRVKIYSNSRVLGHGQFILGHTVRSTLMMMEKIYGICGSVLVMVSLRCLCDTCEMAMMIRRDHKVCVRNLGMS